MSKLMFQVRGRPRPLMRHKHRRGGKGGYDPNKASKEVIQECAMMAMLEQDIHEMEGPLKITCYFFYARPKKSVKDYPAHGYGDYDNLEKLVGDACNKLVYKDDSVITKGKTQKAFSDEDASYIIIETNTDKMLSGQEFRDYWEKLLNA